MPQEWDPTLSLTPGMSPPNLITTYGTHQSKGLTDDGSATSPQSDGTGDQLLPLPTYDAAASQFVRATHQYKELCLRRFLQVRSPAIPPSNFDFSGVFQSEQASCTLPSWLIEAGVDLTGQTQPGHASMYGNTYVPFTTLVLLTGEISHPLISIFILAQLYRGRP